MILDKTVPQIKVAEFEAVLMNAYQRAGLLKPAVESKHADAFSDEVSPSGPRTDNLMLKPKSWSDGQYLSIFPHGRMHGDDMKDAACNIGPACARRDDQLILDALASAGTLSTVGALGVDFTYETLVQVVKTLADKDINLMRYQMCVACPYFWGGKLRNDERIEWKAEKRFKRGTIRFYVGNTEFEWKIKLLPDRSAFGGFDPAQGIGYAFAKESIILGYATELAGDIVWIPQCHSFLATGHMSADAVVRQPECVVKILGQTS